MEDDISPSAVESTVPRRATLACANCRKGKARCVVEVGSDVCQECRKRERHCIWVGSNRGKWSRASKRQKPLPTAMAYHEEPGLQGCGTGSTSATSPSGPSPSSSSNSAPCSSRPEDVVDVHNAVHFKVDSALFPLGLLAEASRQIESNSSQTEPQSQSDPAPHPIQEGRWGPSQMLGVANTKYFHGDIRQQLLPQGNTKARPSILAEQIITVAQAEELFEIYFRLLNPHLGLLDQRSVTPQSCSLRSPFLFMSSRILCAVAARFYRNGILYNVLLQHARRAGMDAMLNSKSTATVQGFVILATWSQPSVSYETDNAYLFAGIAIRIGVEIGLHRKIVLSYPDNMDPSIKQMYTGEVLSRERTWFCVFVLDRSMSALTGKPPQAPETYEIRDVDNWWRRSEAMLSDVFISAVAQLLRLLYRCLDVIYSCNDTVTGVSTGLNYQIVVKDLQWRLDEWAQIWTQNLKNTHHEPQEDGPLDLYLSYLRLYRSFYNLIPLSFGLHHCTIDGFNRVDQISFVTRCYECAVGTLEVVNTELRSKGAFKTAPDICVFAIAYAASFLLKLIGPEFRHLFDETTVLDLVKSTVSHLEEASEDDRHIHYLHSLFLRKHLSMHLSQPTLADTPRPHAQQSQVPSFLIANPMTNGFNTDISVDLDGSVNFVSTSGTEVFRPAEDMSSEWIDSVLGLQNRRDDPFSAGLQMAPSNATGDDFAWWSMDG